MSLFVTSECNDTSTMEVNGIEQEVVTPADTFENHSIDEDVEEVEKAIIVNTEDDKQIDKDINSVVALENLRNNILLAKAANQITPVYQECVNNTLNYIGDKVDFNFTCYNLDKESINNSSAIYLTTEVSLAQIGQAIIKVFKAIINSVKFLFNKLIELLKKVGGFLRIIKTKIKATDTKAIACKNNLKSLTKELIDKDRKALVAEVTEISEEEAKDILDNIKVIQENENNNNNLDLLKTMAEVIIVEEKIPVVLFKNESLRNVLKNFKDLVNILANIANSFKGKSVNFVQILTDAVMEDRSDRDKTPEDDLYAEVVSYITMDSITNVSGYSEADAKKIINSMDSDSVIKSYGFKNLFGDPAKNNTMKYQFIGKPFNNVNNDSGLVVVYAKLSKLSQTKGYFVIVEKAKLAPGMSIEVNSKDFAKITPEEIELANKKFTEIIDDTIRHSDTIISNCTRIVRDLDNLTNDKMIDKVFSTPSKAKKSKLFNTIKQCRSYYKYLSQSTVEITKYITTEMNDFLNLIGGCFRATDEVIDIAKKGRDEAQKVIFDKK